MRAFSLIETVVVVTLLLLIGLFVCNLLASSYLAQASGEQSLTAARLAQSLLEESRENDASPGPLPDRVLGGVTYRRQVTVTVQGRLRTVQSRVTWDAQRGERSLERRVTVCRMPR